MGNTGLKVKDPVKDPYEGAHAHYQLKDPAGNVINPSAFWDQQGPVDPNPAPPTYLGEYQQYLRGLGANRSASASGPAAPGVWSLPNPQPVGSNASGPFGTGGHFTPGSAASSRPLYETRSFVAPVDEAAPADAGKEIRRLARLPAGKADFAGYDPNAPAALPNEIPPADRPPSFDDRFGNRSASSGANAPVTPSQRLSPPPQAGRPLGIVSGRPMPDYPFPPIWGFPGESTAPGDEDWAWSLLRRPDWNKAR
jgi:hypothetical protein